MNGINGEGTAVDVIKNGIDSAGLGEELSPGNAERPGHIENPRREGIVDDAANRGGGALVVREEVG